MRLAISHWVNDFFSLSLLHSSEMVDFTWTFYGPTGLSAKWYENPRNPAKGQLPHQSPVHSEPLKYHRPIRPPERKIHPEMGQATSGLWFTIPSEMFCLHLLSKEDQEKESSSPIEEKGPHPFFHRSLTMAPFRTSCPLNPAWQRQLPRSGHLILSPSLSDGKH